MIKTIYALLLAIILTFFVGLGIEAFYPTEKYPETPASFQYSQSKTEVTSSEEQKAQEDYDKSVKEYQERNSKHARNVSIIAIIGSIIYMILSLTALSKKGVFADGFLVGSLLTLLYGVIIGFQSDSSKFRFLIITIGLAIAMILGYFKFVRNAEIENKELKKPRMIY